MRCPTFVVFSALLLAVGTTATQASPQGVPEMPLAPVAPVAPSAPPAGSEATPHQVYETLLAGHLEEARQMIVRVLRTHPQSATAHYVAAWVYTDSGDMQRGRAELERAEKLEPSLAFAKPHDIEQLRARLEKAASARPQGAGSRLTHSTSGLSK